MSCGSVLPGTWLGLQVHHCCCRGGPVPPFTWLSVSVPGAAEKPYMVEEAVSYNELDYISVSPARVGSPGEPEARGGVGSHLSRGKGARSIIVGCICVLGECSGHLTFDTGRAGSDAPSSATSVGAHLAHLFAWAAE